MAGRTHEQDWGVENPAVEGLSEPCAYSEETLVGCRFYSPRSAHGDFPGAADCEKAFVISGSDHVRRVVCRRTLEASDGLGQLANL